jgi:hypothetical protein
MAAVSRGRFGSMIGWESRLARCGHPPRYQPQTYNGHKQSCESLSKINLDLATQLSRMKRNGPPYVTLKTLIAPECGQGNASGIITAPLEDILNTTRQYLDLLLVIADSPRFLATSAPAALVPRDSLACRSESSNTPTTSFSEDDSSESCDGISPALTPPSSAASGTPPEQTGCCNPSPRYYLLCPCPDVNYT